MTQLEKDLLENVKSSLLSSTDKNWQSGYLEDWVTYAKRMRYTIEANCSTLDAMLKQVIEE